MNIRKAVESDSRDVARVHVQTWQAAYRGVVPDSYLDSLSIDKRETVWLEAIRRGIPELWVAEARGEVIGWVAFGPSRDVDAPAGAGEIEAIYVAPEHWATGVGRALWLTARSRLLERGFYSVMLWVLVDNARAIRFYSIAGFKPNPALEKKIRLGEKILKEVCYEASFG